jgi:hypothetical protein
MSRLVLFAIDLVAVNILVFALLDSAVTDRTVLVARAATAGGLR